MFAVFGILKRFLLGNSTHIKLGGGIFAFIPIYFNNLPNKICRIITIVGIEIIAKDKLSNCVNLRL